MVDKVKPSQVIYGVGDSTSRQLDNNYAGVACFDLVAGTTTTGVSTNVITGTVTLSNPFSDKFASRLYVTAGSVTASDLLDVYIDASLSGGQTWYNFVHFDQVKGDIGTTPVGQIAIAPSAATSGTVVLISEDLTKKATPRPFLGDMIRVRYTQVGASSSFTWSVIAHVGS